jgi:hypothetical protein
MITQSKGIRIYIRLTRSYFKVEALLYFSLYYSPEHNAKIYSRVGGFSITCVCAVGISVDGKIKDRVGMGDINVSFSAPWIPGLPKHQKDITLTPYAPSPPFT